MLLADDIELQDCIGHLSAIAEDLVRSGDRAATGNAEVATLPSLRTPKERRADTIERCARRVSNIREELECWCEINPVTGVTLQGDGIGYGAADLTRIERSLEQLKQMLDDPAGLYEAIRQVNQELGRLDRMLRDLCPLRQNPGDWSWGRGPTDQSGKARSDGWAVALLSHRPRNFAYEQRLWRAVRHTFHNLMATRVRLFDPGEQGREPGKIRIMYQFGDRQGGAQPRQLVRVDHAAWVKQRKHLLIDELGRTISDHGEDGDYTIAYFFVPKSPTTRNDEEMLRSMLGLGWQLATLSPAGRQRQLRFLLCAAPTDLEWHVSDKDARSSPTLFERDAIFDQLSLLFRDDTLLNTAVVHSSMIGDSSVASWFRPIWRIPYRYRRTQAAAEFGPDTSQREWLWATRFMSGQPGDGSAVDIGSAGLQTEVRFYRKGGRSISVDKLEVGTRCRAPTRLLLRSPVLCRMKPATNGRRPNRDAIAAYLLDYSPLSVGLRVPGHAQKLRHGMVFRLEVPSGLPWPWPGAQGGRLAGTTLEGEVFQGFGAASGGPPRRVTLLLR